MYLNENEAKKSIETIIFGENQNEFKIEVFKRKPKDLITKYVFFKVYVFAKNAEECFDKYMNAFISNKALKILQSYFDEEKKLEVFIIKTEIKVLGVKKT